MSVAPDGAFSQAREYFSADWETWFPDHCYICHYAANTPVDGAVSHDQVFSAGAGMLTCVSGCRGCAYEDDTSRCGPHCEPV